MFVARLCCYQLLLDEVITEGICNPVPTFMSLVEILCDCLTDQSGKLVGSYNVEQVRACL